MMSLPFTPVTKFARIDGNTDANVPVNGLGVPSSLPMFAESRLEFNSGNAANPKVDVKHFYPVGADQDWSKLVSINTPVFAKNDDATSFNPKSTIFGKNRIHASVVMDPIHLNHHLATEFINSVNAKAVKFLEDNQAYRVVQLDELYDPIQVMHEIACKWKLAGINIVSAPPGPMDGGSPNPTERCIAARIRGLQLVKNYWDSALHGGYSCFFVIKFLALKSIMRPFYKFGERNGAQAPEFHSAIEGDMYLPQLVAMYDINTFLPLKELAFQINYRGNKQLTLTGIPFYMGMCFYNPQFKRSERDVPIKNIPLANGLVVDSRYPLHVQALMF